MIEKGGDFLNRNDEKNEDFFCSYLKASGDVFWDYSVGNQMLVRFLANKIDKCFIESYLMRALNRFRCTVKA